MVYRAVVSVLTHGLVSRIGEVFPSFPQDFSSLL